MFEPQQAGFIERDATSGKLNFIDDSPGLRLYSRVVAVLYKRTAEEVEKEVRAIKKAGREIRKTPETAREFLRKHGFITKGNKLTKKYGG